jgi:hypothetical protein
MFNDPTEANILTLEPLTARAAITMVVAAREVGIPLIVISGRRNAMQNASAGGAPGSHHLTGKAFDVAVLGYTRAQIPLPWWEMLGSWAEQNLGLRWGGRFVHDGERDVNHFDYGGSLMV